VPSDLIDLAKRLACALGLLVVIGAPFIIATSYLVRHHGDMLTLSLVLYVFVEHALLLRRINRWAEANV
jgi:hypothetical protein